MQLNSHLGQKHLAGEHETQWVKKNTMITSYKKANFPSFQNPARRSISSNMFLDHVTILVQRAIPIKTTAENGRNTCNQYFRIWYVRSTKINTENGVQSDYPPITIFWHFHLSPFLKGVDHRLKHYNSKEKYKYFPLSSLC